MAEDLEGRRTCIITATIRTGRLARRGNARRSVCGMTIALLVARRGLVGDHLPCCAGAT